MVLEQLFELSMSSFNMNHVSLFLKTANREFGVTGKSSSCSKCKHMVINGFDNSYA